MATSILGFIHNQDNCELDKRYHKAEDVSTGASGHRWGAPHVEELQYGFSPKLKRLQC